MSGFVNSIEEARQSLVHRNNLIRRVLEQCGNLSEADLPPVEYVRVIGSDNFDHFKGVMTAQFREMMDRLRSN